MSSKYDQLKLLLDADQVYELEERCAIRQANGVSKAVAEEITYNEYIEREDK